MMLSCCEMDVMYDVHLHTVSLRVEGSAVVELEDDQGESVRLRHLLVVVQGPDLGTGLCNASINRASI